MDSEIQSSGGAHGDGAVRSMKCSVVPVGTIGEFTDAQGRACQCVVRGHDEPPWDNLCLLVDYVHPDGRVIKDAMIGADGFRPDATYQPNDKLRDAGESGVE